MHQDTLLFHLARLRGTFGLRGSQRILVTCLQETIMPTRHLKILPTLIGLCLVLAACGQSGDLYLPAPQQADTQEQPETPEQQER